MRTLLSSFAILLCASIVQAQVKVSFDQAAKAFPKDGQTLKNGDKLPCGEWSFYFAGEAPPDNVGDLTWQAAQPSDLPQAARTALPALGGAHPLLAYYKAAWKADCGVEQELKGTGTFFGVNAKAGGGGSGQGLVIKGPTNGKHFHIYPDEKEVPCANYWIYYIGDQDPQPKGLKWKKVAERNQHDVVRLLNADGQQVRRAWLGRSACGGTIDLKPLDKGKFILVDAGYIPDATDADSTGTNAPCLGGCTACTGFNKYRIVYDVSTNEICVQRRKRRTGTWVAVKDRIIRPGVNKLLDVKYVNYNALRDSLSLEYRFVDLHQENAAEFVNALHSPVNVTPPAPAAVETTNPDSAERKAPFTAAPEEFTSADADLKDVRDAVAALAKYYADQAKELDALDTPPLDPAAFHADERKDAGILCTGRVKLVLNNDTKFSRELGGVAHGIAAQPEKNAFEALLKQMQTDHDRLYTKLHVDAVTPLVKAFNEVLADAKQSAMTPDRERLRQQLDTLIKQYEPDLYRPGASIGAMFDALPKEAVDRKVISDPDGRKKLADQIAELKRIQLEVTTYKVFALAPIQMRDFDRLELQFRRNGRPLNDSPYEIYAFGGWKVDFSTGASFSGLFDRSYYWDGVRTTTEVLHNQQGGDSTTVTRTFATIKQSDRQNFELNLAILAHGYIRTGTLFNVGPAFGMAVQSQNVKWLTGASLLIGHKQRFVFTVGKVWGTVQRLQDGLSLDSEKEYTSTQLALKPATQGIPMDDWFFSITLNFAGITLGR